MPDFIAIELQQFSVNCPGCKSLVTRTLGHAKRNPKTVCGNCRATVDLETPEAKARQSEAAIAAMERAAKDAAGP
jgi:transposase-like protein